MGDGGWRYNSTHNATYFLSIVHYVAMICSEKWRYIYIGNTHLANLSWQSLKTEGERPPAFMKVRIQLGK